MSKPIAGAQLYTVRDFCKTLDDTAKTIERVQAMGYTAVQLSGVGPMKNDPQGLAKLIRDSGINACCTHITFPELLEETDRVIDEHRAWGAPHIAIGGLPAEYFQPGGVARFVSELEKVSPKIKAAEMDFSYHNHSHEFKKVEQDKIWLELLYETASPDILKAELDTYWVAAGGGSPASWIRKLGKRQPLMHLKDMVIGEERAQLFAPIGRGNLDWPDIFAAAEEVGVKYMLVEQDRCYDRDPFDELETSYKFIASMGYR